jgi:hypothetical protein
MSSEKQEAEAQFCFESFGVSIRVESSNPKLLQEARSKVEDTFVDNFRIVDAVETPYVYQLKFDGSTYSLVKEGHNIKFGESKMAFLRSLDTFLRLTVAEFAVDKVFVHAGVVGWKGKAIVIPGNSFSGKTSLVAELVKKGADYYSDEYAVFDENGLVHPFARKLAVRHPRYRAGVLELSHVTARDLGGHAGTTPIPVGCVLITEFNEKAEWQPVVLSAGKGVLEMLSQTIPIRYKPKFSLEILKKVAASAIILKSCRSDAAEFSEIFLEFVDNKVF